MIRNVLRPYALLSEEKAFQIKNWIFTENKYMREVICSTFAHRAKYGDFKPNFAGFTDMVFEICEECMKTYEPNDRALKLILH